MKTIKLASITALLAMALVFTPTTPQAQAKEVVLSTKTEEAIEIVANKVVELIFSGDFTAEEIAYIIDQLLDLLFEVEIS